MRPGMIEKKCLKYFDYLSSEIFWVAIYIFFAGIYKTGTYPK